MTRHDQAVEAFVKHFEREPSFDRSEQGWLDGFKPPVKRYSVAELRALLHKPDGAGAPDPYEVEKFLDWLESR